MITTITASMVNVALPTLAEEFRADITTVQWVALIFFVIVSSLHLTTGRYGDMYGRRGAFAAGCLLFALASLACGLAPGIGWLIAARVVVAVGSRAPAVEWDRHPGGGVSRPRSARARSDSGSPWRPADWRWARRWPAP